MTQGLEGCSVPASLVLDSDPDERIVCRECGERYSTATWDRLSVLGTAPANNLKTLVVRWPDARSIEARECSACREVISQVVDDCWPAATRFSCWVCSRDYSREAWRRLSLVRIFLASEIRAHVCRWTDDHVIETRECVECRRAISRIVDAAGAASGTDALSYLPLLQ